MERRLLEYDFSGGVRGKYAEAFRAGTNLLTLDPEVAVAFPNSEAVNDVLRALIEISRRAVPGR